MLPNMIRTFSDDADISGMDGKGIAPIFRRYGIGQDHRAALQKGYAVSISGFGSFKVIKRKARKGRNPRTGKEIQIPASKTAKFTAGKGATLTRIPFSLRKRAPVCLNQNGTCAALHCRCRARIH